FLLVVEVGEKQGEELTGAVLEDRVMRRVERRDHRLEQMHLRILPPRHRRRPSLLETAIDRKSTRLNSSHLVISYAVFCLKQTSPTPGSNSPWRSGPCPRRLPRATVSPRPGYRRLAASRLRQSHGGPRSRAHSRGCRGPTP